MAPRLAALAANCGQLPMKAQEFGVRLRENRVAAVSILP
jgi:hypothetical protein